MAENTPIEWCHRPGTVARTWNPTTGCSKISPGCGLPRFEADATGGCYAMAMAKRLKATGQAKYQTDGEPVTSGPGFGVATHPDTLGEPLKWRRPSTVFVNSMSDLFHAKVPREFVAQVFTVMAATPQHTYQILTKRPERMARMLGMSAADDFLGESFEDEVARQRIGNVLFDGRMSDPYFARVTASRQASGKDPYDRHPFPQWPLRNVWVGCSVEHADYLPRLDHLRRTPAAVRFVSAEPLLGPLGDIDLSGIDWLICGGESGPGARPMHPDWARSLRDQCQGAGVAFFFKQWGAYGELPTRHGDPGVTVANDGTVYQPGDLAWPDGPRTGEAIRAGHDKAHLHAMYRVGKKTAGHELDGRTWHEFPQAVTT